MGCRVPLFSAEETARRLGEAALLCTAIALSPVLAGPRTGKAKATCHGQCPTPKPVKHDTAHAGSENRPEVCCPMCVLALGPLGAPVLEREARAESSFVVVIVLAGHDSCLAPDLLKAVCHVALQVCRGDGSAHEAAALSSQRHKGWRRQHRPAFWGGGGGEGGMQTRGDIRSLLTVHPYIGGWQPQTRAYWRPSLPGRCSHCPSGPETAQQQHMHTKLHHCPHPRSAGPAQTEDRLQGRLPRSSL